MLVQEITAEENYGYKAFLLEGLKTQEIHFRISPEDELNEPFPTRGQADSFTLAAISEEGKLMGVVSFQREGTGREKLRHKGLLFRMYVSPLHGGQGIGQALIKEVVDRALQLPGMEQIILTVVATNTKANHIYKKAGFESYGLEPRAIKYKGQYFDEEFMILHLLKA